MSLVQIANAALEQFRAKQAPQRGITVADVLRLFPGAKVRPTEPEQQSLLPCRRCGGNMRERLGKGRWHIIACSHCGRKAK